MTMNQIHAFIRLYEEGSFSKAAELLNITQSGISQQIRNLENEMDCMLFLRHSHPVLPTEAARAFYPYARQMAESCREGLERVSSLRERGSFSMAYHMSVHSIMDRYIASRKRDRLPELMNITRRDFLSCDQWVENRLYLVRENTAKSKKIYFAPLYRCGLYAAVMADSPLAAKEMLEIGDLSGQTMILPNNRTPAAQAVYSLSQSDPSIRIFEKEHDFASALRYVTNRGYIAFCTEEYCMPIENVKYVPFDARATFVYGLASLNRFTPEMKAFIRDFKSWYSENSGSAG